MCGCVCGRTSTSIGHFHVHFNRALPCSHCRQQCDTSNGAVRTCCASPMPNRCGHARSFKACRLGLLVRVCPSVVAGVACGAARQAHTHRRLKNPGSTVPTVHSLHLPTYSSQYPSALADATRSRAQTVNDSCRAGLQSQKCIS